MQSASNVARRTMEQVLVTALLTNFCRRYVRMKLKCCFERFDLTSTQMDGVDQLNNILIIGMTNRLDMIDEALLRPGRLEVHMEISLPDEKGRLQILNIHTAKMRTNQIMDYDVDLVELASLTKNFSGAEISGLVKSATSFAFNRHVKVVISLPVNTAR